MDAKLEVNDIQQYIEDTFFNVILRFAPNRE